MWRLIAGILFIAGVCLGQGPKILIVTDLEGVGGVNDADEQLLPGQRRYMESRKILTGEVNAAVEGALLAGAGEIVIWDGHDGSRTLSVDEIHPSARLIQGKPTPANYYFSEKLYDGVMFVGQHAMAGTKNAVLAHTQSFSVKRLTLNDREVGEMGQVAAIAGYFGIPVIMLSGDEAACLEMTDLQPTAATVAVKGLAGKQSSLSLSHEVAKQKIREAARTAVAHARDFNPWKIPGPVELVFEYKPGPGETAGRIVTFRGATVLEAYEAWLGKP